MRNLIKKHEKDSNVQNENRRRSNMLLFGIDSVENTTSIVGQASNDLVVVDEDNDN